MLRTLFVDFNSYFASVEQQVKPHLRGRPVGVVPLMAETTSCIAASYEAKKFGVRTGTGVAEARRLCPEIVFVEAKHEIYVEFHELAVAAVDRICPVRQVLSIDEMECELTGRWRERERAVDLAHKVKHEVESTVGECLTSSIGIAPNTLLGKLASNMQKPNGLTVLELADVPAKLLHLQLRDINGVGPRMLERLQRCGIHSVEQLFAAPRDLLHTAWGGLAGDDMYDRLRGRWYGPRESDTKSLGHSHVLPPDMRNPQGALDVLNRLTQKAAMRLRKQGFYATAMSVHVRCGHRYRSDAAGQRDTRFGQSQDTAFFLHVLQELWNSGLDKLQGQQAVGITLLGLVPVGQHTPSLFDQADEEPAIASASQQVMNGAPARDRSRLLTAMDGVNKTYGKNALYFATSHRALDHAPMRIAFNRIPDIETER